MARFLISSDYSVTALINLQFLSPFLPDPELEELLNNPRYLKKLEEALVRKDNVGTPSMIRLKGFSNRELQTRLADISKSLTDKSLHYIVTKNPFEARMPPISAYDPTDRRLFDLLEREFHVYQADADHLARFTTVWFSYIESDKLFKSAVEFTEKGASWLKASRLHYRNCHHDPLLWKESMQSWLKSDIGYVWAPHQTLPIEFIQAMPSEVLIQAYGHKGLTGYLPTYPDLAKKCLGIILHKPEARKMVTGPIRRATWIKPTPLEEYRKVNLPHMPAKDYPMSMYLIDLLLINHMQTSPHKTGQFLNFTNCVEYQQLPENIRPHPDCLRAMMSNDDDIFAGTLRGGVR